tara:strand:+ start:4001 stop:5938 length:1938 start_codon:yes stop_codon:yes gene_type:complete
MLSFLKRAHENIGSSLASTGAQYTKYLTTPGKVPHPLLCSINRQGRIAQITRIPENHSEDKNNGSMCRTDYQIFEKSKHCRAYIKSHRFHQFKDALSYLGKITIGRLRPDHPVFELIRRIELIDSDAFVDHLNEECRKFLQTEGKIKRENIEAAFAKVAVAVIFENHQRISSGSDLLVHNDASYQELIATLCECELAPEEDATTTLDAFGERGTISNDTWAEIDIKKFGRISPYMRNEKIPAFKVYGLNSVQACPVTVETQQKLYNTFSALTAARQRDSTWTIENGSLMICVPDELIDDNVPLDGDVSKFDHLCPIRVIDPTISPEKRKLHDICEEAKQIISGLRGKAKKAPESNFEMIVIKKHGKGSIIVECEKTVSLLKLSNAIESWTRANHESIITPGLTNDYIGPIRAVNVLNRCWTRNTGLNGDGQIVNNYAANTMSSRFSISDALRLYLDNDVRVAQRAIRQLARHHIYLLIDVKSRLVRGDSPVIKNIRYDVLKIPALLNILSLKLKGTMMSDLQTSSIPFKMGKIVGLADRLHKVWCFAVHDGNMPTKLVGSACAPNFLAGHTTQRQWTYFVKRLHCFMSWADTISDKQAQNEAAKNGRIFSRTIKKYTREMSDIGEIPTTMSDEAKAHFAQGFYSA